MTVPSVADWAWLGRQRLKNIARWGTTPSEPATWVKRAYAWIYARLDDTQRKELRPPLEPPSGPPVGLIPVLAACHSADGEAGYLGFVSVTFEPTTSPQPVEDCHRAAHNAATAVGDAFRRLNHELGHPRVELLVHDAGGPSVALSAVIAALVNLLALTPGEDFVATGCMNEKQELTPVDPGTLPAKLSAARRWGYQKLLVIEGQGGISSQCDLEIVEIPRNLAYAIFPLLRVVASSSSGIALARSLAVFDQTVVRADPRDRDLERTLQITQEFVTAGSPPLPRHIAHDIRSRALLHAGRTVEATEEKKQADAVRPEALDFPSGWLGDYLKWHQVAHHAVLALDQGRWDEDEPEHRLLDRTLQRLVDAIADKQAAREELLAALFLGNTRGRRFDFLGRLRRDGDLLARAWEDVTRFRRDWRGLFQYCREIGLNDSDLRRQQNCCLDVLASYWHLHGQLPATWSEVARTFWPEDSAVEVEQLGPFDLPYFVRWKVISGQQVGVDLVRRILTSARGMFEQMRGEYPTFLAFESILRYGVGNEQQRREAADALANSKLFSVDLSPRSVLTLLALRAESLLKKYGCFPRTAVRPAPGTRLGKLADELLSHPESLVDRCPY